MGDFLLLSAGLIVGMMFLLWLLSLPLKDVSIVDIFWGTGFVIVGWGTYLAADVDARDVLPPLLCTLWGLRLSGYLAWRNHGEPEDHRYRAMRERHGRRFVWVSLFTVFGLQGVVMWVVALPLQTAQLDARRWLWLQGLGSLIWIAGLLFESIGDRQLARFKANPNNDGAVLDRGLWRYTRHPNYFGDFIVWWGLYLVAVGTGSPWWTIVGPVVMSVLLMRISGVTLLEKSLRQTKPAYTRYMRRTNAFFPGPPGDGQVA